jgi:hypothetical protein
MRAEQAWEWQSSIEFASVAPDNHYLTQIVGEIRRATLSGFCGWPLPGNRANCHDGGQATCTANFFAGWSLEAGAHFFRHFAMRHTADDAICMT